jgi:RNA recognition motif-containing protein
MFIGNIPSGVTDQELREKFKQYGAVETGYVIKDHRTGLNSNFGYILFKDPSVLQHVINMEVRMNGRLITCQEFKGKKNKHPTIPQDAERNSKAEPPKAKLDLAKLPQGSKLSKFSDEFMPSPGSTRNKITPKNQQNRCVNTAILRLLKNQKGHRDSMHTTDSADSNRHEILKMMKMQAHLIDSNHRFGNCSFNEGSKPIRSRARDAYLRRMCPYIPSRSRRMNMNHYPKYPEYFSTY